jgi:hypothetical protein
VFGRWRAEVCRKPLFFAIHTDADDFFGDADFPNDALALFVRFDGGNIVDRKTYKDRRSATLAERWSLAIWGGTAQRAIRPVASRFTLDRRPFPSVLLVGNGNHPHLMTRIKQYLAMKNFHIVLK